MAEIINYQKEGAKVLKETENNLIAYKNIQTTPG
jgi:hypothetical protein